MEEKIGVVTDYLNRLGVAVIHLTDGELHVGDQVRIGGRTTELRQSVESLQIEHQAVAEAPRGSEVAMKVEAPVHRKDQVFRVQDRAFSQAYLWAFAGDESFPLPDGGLSP
jgi:putative protease